MKRIFSKNKRRSFARSLVLMGAVLFLGACSGSGSSLINNVTKFSSSEYGVAASPRLTSSGNVPKGGGRYMVGRPYRVAGNWYHPSEDTSYDKTGLASWYGPNFHGRQTANGEIFDQFHLSAAHPTLPLPSYVRVQNLANGRSTIVRVNDRGPFAHNRLIDLSRRAAEVLGFINDGTARVRVTYVGRAPVEGDDSRYLVASIDAPAGSVPPASSSGDRPSIISREGGGLFGAFASLFSYAGSVEGEAIVNDAHAAASEMAGRAPQLETWQAGVELAAIEINLEIGTFSDANIANEIARRFAFLGSVEQEPVSVQGVLSTRLTLTHLKSGVEAEDVANMGVELGVDHIAAYK